MISVLIISHVISGTIALLSGLLDIASKKGGKLHRKSGRVFYFSMLISSCTALLTSSLTGHENVFLFGIGLFSTYFTLSAYASLRLLKSREVMIWDRLITLGLLLAAIYVLLSQLLGKQELSVVSIALVIGSLCFVMVDFRNYKFIQTNNAVFLKFHVIKMMSAYISALTALFVVNNMLPIVLNWLVPSVLGTVYIIWSLRKLKRAN